MLGCFVAKGRQYIDLKLDLGTVNPPEIFRLTMSRISQPCSLTKPLAAADSALEEAQRPPGAAYRSSDHSNVGMAFGQRMPPRRSTVGVLMETCIRALAGRVRKGSHGAGQYARPGGKLEWRETWADCARREVLEETAISLYDVPVTYCYTTEAVIDDDTLADSETRTIVVSDPSAGFRDGVLFAQLHRLSIFRPRVSLINVSFARFHCKGGNALLREVPNP